MVSRPGKLEEMAPASTRIRMRHVLAGIGLGVAGAIFVLLFLMLGSLWYRRSMWIPANLFSTAVYGPDAYINHLAATSWAGVAIVVVMYGVAGALWGIVWRDRRPRYLLLYGAICGAITYLLLFDVFWKRLDPFLSLYAPDRQLELANLIWGMFVVRSPALAARIESRTSAAQEQEVEVRSGEVLL
jgi:hypothetical protein